MAEIIVCIKEREIARFPVMKTWMSIGRDSGNDMTIDNESVSRFHAALSYTAGQGFVIEDRGSSNGITVNGVPTSCTVLRPGDRIGVGKYSLLFVAEGGVPADKLTPAEAPSDQSESLHRRTYMMSADVVKQYQEQWQAAGLSEPQNVKRAAPQPIALESSKNTGLVVAIVAVALVLVGLVVWLLLG